MVSASKKDVHWRFRLEANMRQDSSTRPRWEFTVGEQRECELGVRSIMGLTVISAGLYYEDE